MNSMTNIKNIQRLNERMLEMGEMDDMSWHRQYKDSAYIFIGGLPYDLTEGDILCVFSQYGEIVNVNLVRDKATGKQKGFCFLCYEDQRSTILAVDNLNGIKLGGRTIRVDHCADYRRPKGDEKDEDGNRKEIIEEGCAPKTPSPSPSEDEEEPLEPIRKKKKIKKEKKHKKHKQNKHKKDYSSGSESEDKDKKHKGKDGKPKPELSHRECSSEKVNKFSKDSQTFGDKQSSTRTKTREWDYGKRLDDKHYPKANDREWEAIKRHKAEGRHERREQRHTIQHDSSSENRARRERGSSDYHKDNNYSYSQHKQNSDNYKSDRRTDYYRERERRDRK